MTISHLDATQNEQHDKNNNNRANQTTTDIHCVSLELEFHDEDKQPLRVRASSREARTGIRLMMTVEMASGLVRAKLQSEPQNVSVQFR
jgi:hypothetical protein